jgi:hypothetical protein
MVRWERVSVRLHFATKFNRFAETQVAWLLWETIKTFNGVHKKLDKRNIYVTIDNE